jgi:hypothetical protein
MIALNIDGKKYKLAEAPTPEVWMSLMKYEFEEELHWPHIIRERTGLPLETCMLLDREQQKLAVVMIATSIAQRDPIEMPDLNAVTFGQWVDIEYYLAMGLDKTLRQVLDRLEIQTNSIQSALWIIETYAAWRTNIYKQYKALFSYDDEALDEYAADAPKQSATQIAKAWYNIMVDLSGDNILRIEAITSLGVKEVFNFMAVRKEKQLAEMQRNKQIKRQYDIQGSRR